MRLALQLYKSSQQINELMSLHINNLSYEDWQCFRQHVGDSQPLCEETLQALSRKARRQFEPWQWKCDAIMRRHGIDP